jgi:hypothetical protein
VGVWEVEEAALTSQILSALGSREMDEAAASSDYFSNNITLL